MTTKVEKEENANPYNMNKSWHNVKEEEFVSADSVYYGGAESGQPEEVQEVKAQKNVEKKERAYKRPDYKKRYDEMKRHHDKTVGELRAEVAALKEQQEVTEYEAPETLEELESFRDKYPDVYKVVETVAHLKSSEKAKNLEEKLNVLQRRENELVQKDALTRLEKAHPDFREVKNSKDFKDWTDSQPASIQDWIRNNANDADLAIRAIDLFKKDMGIGVPERKQPKLDYQQSKSQAAEMVSTKTTSFDSKEPKVWTEKEILALSPAEFDRLEQEIDKAWEEGRIVR
jgi:hypothetical protein